MHRKERDRGTSLSLAAQLAGQLTSPSRAAMRDELVERLREAFDDMDHLKIEDIK